MTNKPKRRSVAVKGAAVSVFSRDRQDFISLTDIARYKDAERTDYLISNWLASCLTALDEMIFAQTQKLDALKTHKKGLMQQLFPSPAEVEA